MRVKVRFFAILRERSGVDEVGVELAEGATIGDLWRTLQARFPKLASGTLRLLYAVNREYVREDHVLHEGDEVVFIPPVSGG
jgi:molybdopterin converting factor subunit 1